MPDRTVQYYVVDAFTDRAFRGNPAAVVWEQDGEPLTAEQMQLIAMEMNLSETAFITNTSTENTYGLRWFTPTVEIDLCGHATLAAYTIVRKVKGDATATFNSQVSGDLITSVTENGLMQLSFPANPYAAVAESAVEVDQVRNALPAELEIVEIARGGSDVVVEVKLAPGATLADVKPDHGVIKDIDARGLVVTTVLDTPPSAAGPLFHSRFFAPRCGVEEDPVCGSTHTHLAVKYARKFNMINQEMSALHGGPRQGELWVQWDEAAGRVYIRGLTKIVAKGEMYMS